MRVKITVQYLGTNYCGWQLQQGHTTIQQVLEDALYKALGEKCITFASGRTDAGVHAWGQVAHFDTTTKIKADKIAYAVNRFLPNDVQIINSTKVADDFNARFDVRQKTYEYNFYSSITDFPLLSETFARVRTDFDFTKANQNLEAFLGTHDFKGFCSINTQTSNTVRTIYAIKLEELGENKYKLTISGNGFLYNMVRIIVGTIIFMGYGKIDPKNLPSIINSKDRSKAGKTASAKGLTLKSVEY